MVQQIGSVNLANKYSNVTLLAQSYSDFCRNGFSSQISVFLKRPPDCINLKTPTWCFSVYEGEPRLGGLGGLKLCDSNVMKTDLINLTLPFKPFKMSL